MSVSRPFLSFLYPATALRQTRFAANKPARRLFSEQPPTVINAGPPPDNSGGGSSSGTGSGTGSISLSSPSVPSGSSGTSSFGASGALKASLLPAAPIGGPPPRTPAALTHYFDTFHIVTRLEAAGFQHGQAVAMMNAIRALLVAETETCKAEMLSRADLENQSYLFRAAMSELLAEIKMLRRNEATELRLETLHLQRKLEVLDQQMREDLQTMRTEVEMDVEMRRSQTRSDAKDIELRIQELDNKFTVKLGDLRTAMERYKWDSTRRLLLGLVTIAVIGTYLINRPKKKELGKGDEGTGELDLGLLDSTHARPGNTFVSLG